MNIEELSAWLRLSCTPKLGRSLVRRLLNAASGSPEWLCNQSIAWLTTQGGTAAAALGTLPEGFDQLLNRTKQWLDEHAEEQNHIVAMGDERYPRLLLETADPPLFLYAKGNLELLNRPCIAIVGSRHATPQGEENAFQFARNLSKAGICIASGLALGIDGAAHQGALLEQGSTIAVVGTGIDRIYPKAHGDLARKISQHGLILSEYPLGTPPLPAHFPQRNRIIAGLSQGCLVVEAAVQSGSLITAKLSLEFNREVFAIPGSIHAPQARGCHALIKQGAKLVETAQDILDELTIERPSIAPELAPSKNTREESGLLSLMGHDPISLDTLCQRTGCGVAELSAHLLDLELSGQIVRLPGQLFQRVTRC